MKRMQGIGKRAMVLLAGLMKAPATGICFVTARFRNIDFQIMISGQDRGKQAYCRKSMTDNAARIFNLDVYRASG